MHNGNNALLLVWFMVLAAACGKPAKENIQPDNEKMPVIVSPIDYATKYTPNMAGMRKWTRSSNNSYPSGTHDTVTYGHLLQVTVINDTTISFRGDTLGFVSDSITPMGYIVETDTSFVLSFWDKTYQPNPRGIKMLSYYYKADSIVYQHNWQALGGSTSEKYYTE